MLPEQKCFFEHFVAGSLRQYYGWYFCEYLSRYYHCGYCDIVNIDFTCNAN